MKIYLIRHGQAIHNLSGNVGILDPELTDLGYKQCEKYKPQYFDVDMVISSTSQRALQTARQLFDCKIYATDLLLEYNTSVACNKHVDLTIQQSKFSNVDFDTYKVVELPIETTWDDGNYRAAKIIQMLQSIDDKIKTIAVVSHANIIRNIIYQTGTYKHEDLDNCDAYVIYK